MGKPKSAGPIGGKEGSGVAGQVVTENVFGVPYEVLKHVMEFGGLDQNALI